MLYALHFLKPGGRLVAITSAMAGVGNTRARQYFRATMQALGADRSQLPEDAFAASGTRVHTALWLLTMPASVELPPEAPPEETPAPPPANPVDALDELQHAAYQCVEGSLGHAEAPEDLADDLTQAVDAGVPTQLLTALLASCDIPWPEVPRCTHEVSAGQCTHQARYQVHANFFTRTWQAVQVKEQPRYCRQHADELARHYTSTAASTRR